MEGGGMKKICIFLMKVNRWYYVLLGTIIGLLIFVIKKEARALFPDNDTHEHILIIAIAVVFFLHIIAKYGFYSGEEIAQNEANGYMDPSLVNLFGYDYYFVIKINTELTWIKRLSGYLYVTLGSTVYIFYGYVFALIAFVLFIK
jgi:hypothetical protein